MKVSVSISDLPVFQGMEYLFSGLKEAGADGLEVVTGVKSRWSWNYLHELTVKYKLPVTSVHQPPWSAISFLFDEEYMRLASEIGIKTFVYHPLPKYSFADKQMKDYAKRLAALAKKFDIDILLENMPAVYRRTMASRFYPLHDDTKSLPLFIPFLKKYDLGFNLDISHAFLPEPQKEKWFDELYPRLKNIHLSSFRPGKDHLPLYLGDFKTKEFIKELEKRKYTGLITLEVFYPRMIRLNHFDFEAIKKSIALVKSV